MNGYLDVLSVNFSEGNVVKCDDGWMMITKGWSMR